MSGDPRENDPFIKDYTGGHALEKQTLQREVEERYNVKVTYVPYPANAAWGPSRVQARIEATIDGKPLRIYTTTLVLTGLHNLRTVVQLVQLMNS